MNAWIIEDWMGKRVFADKSFGSFEEARDYITEHANATAKDEDEFDGICEDLYAVESVDLIREHLEYLRSLIRRGCISYGELAELQSLADYIEAGDTELLEWAGVSEEQARAEGRL